MSAFNAVKVLNGPAFAAKSSFIIGKDNSCTLFTFMWKFTDFDAKAATL